METATPQTRHGGTGGAVIFGAVITLLLLTANVVRHPASIQGTGRDPLVMDVALLLAYSVAGALVSLARAPKVGLAANTGAKVGILLGAVYVVSHSIESFVPNQPPRARLAVGAGPVLAMMALFSVAGSAGWVRTRSVWMATVAGLSCAAMGVLILLSFGLFCNLAFETALGAQLREAIVASGASSDPGVFLVRNSVQAVSEGLVRMPVLGLLVSLIAGLSSAWMWELPRATRWVVAWLAPMMLVIGTAALWYANSLDRSARPPFILFGVSMAGIALATAVPAWMALHRPEAARELRDG